MNNLYHGINVFLADVTVLAQKVHNIHWNIKGPDFIPVHEFLDGYYDSLQEMIDLSAERLIMIGDRPIGSLKDVLAHATILELKDEDIYSKAGFTHLINDFTTLRDQALRIINLADQADDPGTADTFTEFIKVFEKNLWVLNSYIS